MKRVFLTIDVECHDFSMQNQYLWGKSGNREYGIKCILELGKELGIPINFFIDFAECSRYGEAFISKIVDMVKEYGQGVYLHLHPNFISGDDSRTFFWQYSCDEQLEILKSGFDIYKRIMGRADCPGFRIGRYGANRSMYKAMQKLGISTVDFSYCYDCPKMCGISFEELQTINIPIEYCGQVIFPNTSYIGFKLGKWKKAFIMDASDTTVPELKKLVSRNTLENITITMHSWNFIKKYFFNKKILFGNKREIKKFKKMIEIIKNAGYEFCDIERNFAISKASKNDEIIDLCTGLKGLLTSYISNFTRFQKIARLNKKYFIIYFMFYSVVVFLAICVLL